MWRNLLVGLFALITLTAVFLYLRDPYSDAPSTTQRAEPGSNDRSTATVAQDSGSTVGNGTSAVDNPFSTVDQEPASTTTQSDIIKQYTDLSLIHI